MLFKYIVIFIFFTQISFSQTLTGTVKDSLGNPLQNANVIAKPLLESKDIAVAFHEIQLENPFPFPWNNETFFGAFPESFLQIPTAFKPVPKEILDKKYDLILLNYQVWYLSPSIPINSFLKLV